jgi:hypothetical protein
MQLPLQILVRIGLAVGLGASTLLYTAVGMAQAPATTSTPVTKGTTFYDRYMVAGYEATKRRDHQTALIYFKRALDERPDDTFATQAIRNVEGYLKQAATPSAAATPPALTVPKVPTVVVPPIATPTSTNPAPKPAPAKPASTRASSAKPTSTQATAPKPAPTKSPAPAAKTPIPASPGATKPVAKPATTANQPANTKLAPPKTPPASQVAATTAKPPAAVVVIPSTPPSEAFNEQQAIALINRWLQAKTEVFAPPYDQQQVADLTTGELLASLVRPNGVLDWLKLNRAYFRYGVQKVDSVERFVVARDRATMEVNLTEDRTLYMNGAIAPGHTDFSSEKVRFTFALDSDTWKIADYKTVNGLLLERAIVGFNDSPRSLPLP